MEINRIRAQMTDKIKDLILPKYEEIPDVGLFLEQVVKYINGYLAILPGMELTGSMVSNYVKKGLISNPVKKQYSRDQIVYLIFIAISKSVLSLDGIRSFINVQKTSYTAEEAYNYFVSELIEMLSYVFELTDEIAVDRENDENEKYEKSLMKNVVITIAHKIYLDMFLAELESERAGEEAGGHR